MHIESQFYLKENICYSQVSIKNHNMKYTEFCMELY